MSNTWVIIKTSLKMAYRSITSRKFRSFLTVLGIMIGITLFITLMSIGIGMNTTISGILSQFIGAEIMVMSKISSSRPSVPSEMVNILGNIDHVEDAYGLIQDYVDVQGNFIMVIGTPPDKIEFLMGIKLKEGISLKAVSYTHLTLPTICSV